MSYLPIFYAQRLKTETSEPYVRIYCKKTEFYHEYCSQRSNLTLSVVVIWTVRSVDGLWNWRTRKPYTSSFIYISYRPTWKLGCLVAFHWDWQISREVWWTAAMLILEKQGMRQKKSDISIDHQETSNFNPRGEMNCQWDRTIMDTESQETDLRTISSETTVTDVIETRWMTIFVIDTELKVTMQYDVIDLIHAQWGMSLRPTNQKTGSRPPHNERRRGWGQISFLKDCQG